MVYWCGRHELRRLTRAADSDLRRMLACGLDLSEAE
jgi:hypothetical protein